jgi:nucleoside-diphosphate-sugar epimerase
VIYGPRDRQFVPRIARLLRWRLAPIVGTEGGRTILALVHAANVADGAVRAAMSDVAGGRAYNLANDYDVTLAEFYRLAGDGLGHTVHLVTVPRSLATVALTVVKSVLALATGGRSTAINMASLDFITRDNPFDSSRARRELGWTPAIRPDAGIPEAFRWCRDHC